MANIYGCQPTIYFHPYPCGQNSFDVFCVHIHLHVWVFVMIYLTIKNGDFPQLCLLTGAQFNQKLLSSYQQRSQCLWCRTRMSPPVTSVFWIGESVESQGKLQRKQYSSPLCGHLQVLAYNKYITLYYYIQKK